MAVDCADLALLCCKVRFLQVEQDFHHIRDNKHLQSFLLLLIIIIFGNYFLRPAGNLAQNAPYKDEGDDV